MCVCVSHPKIMAGGPEGGAHGHDSGPDRGREAGHTWTFLDTPLNIPQHLLTTFPNTC